MRLLPDLWKLRTPVMSRVRRAARNCQRGPGGGGFEFELLRLVDAPVATMTFCFVLSERLKEKTICSAVNQLRGHLC